MLNGLSNYALQFLLILSNISTVVYVYPLFVDYLLQFELKNGDFDVKIVATYLGVKIHGLIH